MAKQKTKVVYQVDRVMELNLWTLFNYLFLYTRDYISMESGRNFETERHRKEIKDEGIIYDLHS